MGRPAGGLVGRRGDGMRVHGCGFNACSWVRVEAALEARCAEGRKGGGLPLEMRWLTLSQTPATPWQRIESIKADSTLMHTVGHVHRI